MGNTWSDTIFKIRQGTAFRFAENRDMGEVKRMSIYKEDICVDNKLSVNYNRNYEVRENIILSQ